MSVVFGEGGFALVRRGAVVTGADDLESTLRAFSSVPRMEPTLLLSRCRPTAAFSRRDTLLPGYGAAAEAAVGHGFTPIIRPVGGHLAAYDEGSVVLHLWSGHPEPRSHIRERFALVAQALVDALEALGVADARVGPVPGEYCDGEWSVNLGGTRKVAGTGQRLSRRGYLFSAVVTVDRAAVLRDMLIDSYAALGLEFDPASVGSLAEEVPGIGFEDVSRAVGAALRRVADSDDCGLGAPLLESAAL